MSLTTSPKPHNADARDLSGSASSIYPEPRVPLAPVLSFRGLIRRKVRGASVFGGRQSLAVTSGRVAIATALKHANLPSGSEVLLPALHCEAMVTPVRWAGLKVAFYPLKPDLSVNFHRLEDSLNAQTRALLLTHFFGFPQDAKLARDFCDKHDLVLIEDCAHAHHGTQAGITLGTFADYAIASTVKFFPVFDGGYLYSSKHDLSTVQLESAPMRFQVKAALNILDRAVAYCRLGVLGWTLSTGLQAARKLHTLHHTSAGRDSQPVLAPASAEGGYDFEPYWYGKKMSTASRIVVWMANEQRIIDRRRSNYLRLVRSLESLKGCRVLFPNLPEGVSPLVFPLYVDNAASSFPRLKELGVPIWRFGEFLDSEIDAQKICPVSLDYAEHLLQFPCHQELKAHELTWLIHTLREILG